MSRQLYIESTGSGRDLVLLHGWGMHSGVWSKVREELAQNFRVHLVDLPGHGRSYRTNSGFTLKDLAIEILEQLDFPEDKKVHWLGWSLGGLLACTIAALSPNQVASLTLVATNLCFTRTDDWPHAMNRDTLEEFASFLMQQPEDTLNQFLGLQVYGQTKARETLKELRQHILNQPSAELEALKAGLDILLESDLRQIVKKIQNPVLMISGEKDRLVPPTSQAESSHLFPQASSQIIKDAGHAVFISQHELFMKTLSEFINNVEAA
jgi:pimeloyl-[acyl-carrier protein] methyl ester esterase